MPGPNFDIALFNSKWVLDPATGCHNWTASVGTAGYGQFGWENRRVITAHRAAWLIHVGPIPKGFHVHHKCLNRLCVRIEHLELMHGVEHGHLHMPLEKFCANNHEYEKVGYYVTKGGWRQCKQCCRDQAKIVHLRKQFEHIWTASTG